MSDHVTVSPCTLATSRLHSYPYLKPPALARADVGRSVTAECKLSAGSPRQCKQLLFKVGSEPPWSHRRNDTIAPCRALRLRTSHLHPLPLYERRSSTFETPFARYQMHFSYTSFSDINYRLYPSLSCGARRDGGRSGEHTLSARGHNFQRT